MARILLLGLDPETVDFSDPALPPGMSVEKVHAGIAIALKGFTDRGWESDVCFIRPDESAGPAIERQLRSTNCDCVVIGAGVRLPPRHLGLLEVLINTIREAAPDMSCRNDQTIPQINACAGRFLFVAPQHLHHIVLYPTVHLLRA